MSVSNTSANALLQSAALPRLRGQTVSLYMLALRGGVSIGSLVTGISVSMLGVRYALAVNGVLAIAAQVAVGRVRVPVERDHRFRWKVITQSGGT